MLHKEEKAKISENVLLIYQHLKVLKANSGNTEALKQGTKNK